MLHHRVLHRGQAPVYATEKAQNRRPVRDLRSRARLAARHGAQTERVARLRRETDERHRTERAQGVRRARHGARANAPRTDASNGIERRTRKSRDDAKPATPSRDRGARGASAARAIAMTSFEYIEPRARVVIHGIKAKPELNGRAGTVMEYVPARARYRVRVSDGDDGEATNGGATEEVYLKPDNVRKAETTTKATTTKATRTEPEREPTRTAATTTRDEVATTSEKNVDEILTTQKAMKEIVPNPDAVAAPIEEIKDSETLLKEFFQDVSDATRDAEVERILSCFKLNPYEFLNLPFDCERKAIPRSFRKISLLVHPDKCKHADAKAAFDALGQAQKLLLDEDFKRTLDFHLEQAKESVLKTWKKEARDDVALRVKYEGNKEGMLEDFCKTDEFHERWKYEGRNYIVELEWRRRKMALRIKGEEKRVTEEEKAELAQRRKEHKEKKEWDQDDRREARVGGWRDFMKDKKAKKTKTAGEFKSYLKTEMNPNKKAFALEKDKVLRPDEIKRAF